tara:strand:- start:214 stop:468 length:255 start_codon:yes stop_codon:yes gene_type:complete
MRHATSEKLVIIRLVEGWRPWGRTTLAKLGIPHSIFYHLYNRYRDYNICILLTKRTAFEDDIEALKKSSAAAEISVFTLSLKIG